jgi:hypothetical protein
LYHYLSLSYHCTHSLQSQYVPDGHSEGGSKQGEGVGPGVGSGVGPGVGSGVGPGVGSGVGPGVGPGVGVDGASTSTAKDDLETAATEFVAVTVHLKSPSGYNDT